MNTYPELLTPEFRLLSAQLGSDPLQVQGPGGNTSIKRDNIMWIKASGTELANAEVQDIFVPVDRAAAIAELEGKKGDGSCKTTVIDPSLGLRPSIETTFHAALNHAVVAHTHSVSTLVHVISPQGRKVCMEKLSGLSFAIVPYAKPRLPLTKKIMANVSPDTKVILLQNHGLICCGDTVEEVSDLIAEVENRLAMEPIHSSDLGVSPKAPEGFIWHASGWIAGDKHAYELAISGSYYPDHVVFLGPALPTRDYEGNPPAILLEGEGIAVRSDATSAQKAMAQCLSDVLSRLPLEWIAEAIGAEAEAELLNWDAEKYRQALAAQK